MSDRHAGYVVSLEQDLHVDDALSVIAALHQIKGVISVEPVVVRAELHIAQARAETKIEQKLWRALHEQ